MPEIDLRLCFFPVAQGLLQLWLLLVSPKGIMAMAGDGTGALPWLEMAQGPSHGWRWYRDLLMATAGGGTGTFLWPWLEMAQDLLMAGDGTGTFPWLEVAWGPSGGHGPGYPGHKSWPVRAALARRQWPWCCLPTCPAGLWAAESRARGAAGEGRGGYENTH